jgi:hypothetical protein
VFANSVYWLHRLAKPPIFVIELRAGAARLTKGSVPASWTSDCGEIAAEFGIAHGYVEGVRTPCLACASRRACRRNATNGSATCSPRICGAGECGW